MTGGAKLQRHQASDARLGVAHASVGRWGAGARASRVRWRVATRPKSAGPNGSGRGAWANAGQAEGMKARGPRGVGRPRELRERARDAGN
jgi:hypothetical protein